MEIQACGLYRSRYDNGTVLCKVVFAELEQGGDDRCCWRFVRYLSFQPNAKA